MNQYDFLPSRHTLCAWPLYRPTTSSVLLIVCVLAVSGGSLCRPAAAQTLPPRSLNEAAITSQTLAPLPSQSSASTGAVAPAPRPEWMLFAGDQVGQQLKQWGQESGWRVIWQSRQDWVVPNDTTFHGSFTDAASQVLQVLASEGAPIHGIFYQGNQTLVVTGETP